MSDQPLIFTTFAASQVESHAGAMVESILQHWPHRLECYTDAVGLPAAANVRGLPALLDIPDPPENREGWQWDVRRFLWKASCIVHVVEAALHRYVIWLDADCYVFKDLPVDFAERMLGGHAYAYIGRKGGYPETGFLAFDTHHAATAMSIMAYRGVYESGELYGNPDGWTDIHAFAMAQSECGVSERNLTPHAKGFQHAWMQSPLRDYMDHMKGPRKAKGYSPEHPHQKGRWHG